MRAGELRHQVTIQQSVATNQGGVPVGDWEDVCTFSAAVEDLSGRELLGQGAIAADVTTRIVARWRSGITPDMRALSGSRIFDVQTVLDPEGRRREMHLMCKERFDGGSGAVAVPAGWKPRSFTGAKDGANRVFVLTRAIPAGGEFVLWNGIKQAIDKYAFDGRTFVLGFAPEPGDDLEFYG